MTASDASFLPSGIAAGSTAYTANSLNQYATVSGAARTYDKRGNLTSDGTWTYGYDAENRLISASKTGSTIAYAYDALGRRKSKTVNGAVTTFADFGDQELAEFSGAGPFTLTRTFVYGPGLDEPAVSVAPGNARTYQFADALGSIIGLANASGQLTEKYAYTAYGQAVVTGAGAAAYRYAGRRFDAETGLYFNRARAYSTALGRFLQTDPIGTKGGINLYAYVGNDPVNLLDPFGTTAKMPGSSGGFIPSLGQGLANAVPGAYYAGLAEQQFQQGNYGAAAIYGTASIADAAVGIATLGVGAQMGAGVRAAEEAATAAGGGLTRVGRWMSQGEFDAMSETGLVQEGAGGRTYVVNPANPAAYQSAAPGSVYSEFNVPTDSLFPAGKPEWPVIPGPNVTTRLYGPAPTSMPPATCIVCVIGGGSP